MSTAIFDTEGGGGDTGRPSSAPVPSRYLTGFRYEGAGANRVRFDQFSDQTEEGPFEDPEVKGEDGTTKPPPVTTKTVVGSPVQFVRNGRNILRTTYTDGTFTDEDLGPVEGPDTSAADAQNAATGQRRENAFNLITAFLQKAGLAGLDKNIRELLATGIEDSDAILFRLRDTDQFKARFKANAARTAKGLPELDPASYIGLEQAYAATLRANRLPSGFYDQSDDFNALIEGDVSPQELQARISEGFVKVRDADPEVRRQMQTLYGVGSDEQLAAYFLDPEKGLQALQRQARAAEISARGREQGRLQLTVGQAEELARRGITPEEAQRQFMQRGMLEGLYQPMTGEEALTPEGEIGAIFEYDPVAQRRLAQRRAQRIGEFQAGGQFARTSGATSGTVETGVGLAQ